MPKGLVSELESWREYQRQHIKEDQLTYDLIFCQENGNPISVHYFRKLFYRYVHMQNLPHVVPYSLRQSSADTKMVLSKGDVTTVQAETAPPYCWNATQRCVTNAGFLFPTAWIISCMTLVLFPLRQMIQLPNSIKKLLPY